jgi:replicative DNA helicase
MARRHPEQLLISAVIQTSDISTAEQSGIRADHFHAYRATWEWLESYHIRYRKVPSKPVFRREFADFPLLKTTDVEYAAEEVRRNHLRQELARSVGDAVDLLKHDEVEDALATLAPVVTRLEQDFDAGRVLDAAKDAKSVFNSVQELIEITNKRGLPGIATGFPSLDERTGGFQPGHFWVVAARLGNGKSWAMTHMGVEAALAGHSVLFHTLEMSRRQVALRTHTFFGRKHNQTFTNRQLNTGNILSREYRDFVNALPEKVPGEFVIVDRARGRVTPFSIAANIERFAPDVVFIDYIQLMATSNGNKADWESLAQLSGELQSLCQETSTPIVVASQINRDGATGRHPPSVDKLARSDAIGQDADGVLTLKQHTKRTLEMRLAKWRHGVSDYRWWTKFDPDHGIIEECTHEQAQDFQMEDEEDEE